MGVVDMCGYVVDMCGWMCVGVMDVSMLVVHYVCTLISEPRAAMLLTMQTKGRVNLKCSDKRTPYHEVKMFISMVM